MLEEQKGAAQAENILEDLGFDSLPIIPSEVASAIDDENFHVEMESVSFSSDKILGKAIGNNKGALVYVNSNIQDEGRFNFTAAHEVGHVCMHIMPQQKMSFECGPKEINNPYNDPIEKEANGFASGLLLPKNLIQKITDRDIDWNNIWTIANTCKTSLEATYRRMSFLNNDPSALVIHRNGQFKRFVASDNFDFFIENSPLSSDQKNLCVDISTKEYPADFENVDASDWVNAYSKGSTLETIYASSILLNDGFTYTILTYDDDCFVDEDY